MTNPRPHCQGGAGEKTEPTSTRSGFGARSGFGMFGSSKGGKFCSSKLLCVIVTMVVGLGLSAFALSSHGSGGISEHLESVFLPNANAGQLKSTGWTPDDTKRPGGSYGPRSRGRGFALPKNGTYGWHKWAVERIAERCMARDSELHSHCARRDMYQFGVYTGRSLKGTTQALRAKNVRYHTFWGCDSFQGLPEEDASEQRSSHSKGEWQTGTFNAADMFKVRHIAS